MNEDWVYGAAEAASNETAQQVFQLFVLPEMVKRYQEGKLDPKMIAKETADGAPGVFKSPYLSLVLFEDNRPNTVFFDGEYEIELLMIVPKEKLRQEAVHALDGEFIKYRFLKPMGNAGWLLMINQAGRVSLAYNLTRNGVLAKEHLRQARGFIDAARYATTRRHPRVAVENLFHAIEKICKAELMTLPLGLRGKDNASSMERVHHGRINELYRSVGRSADALALMEELTKLRTAATYHTAPFHLTWKDLRRFTEAVAEVQSEAHKWLRVATRTPVKARSR